MNEVGLDPGIDHLMAHDLVARYRASPAYHADNVLSFTSYCGGVPKIPNPFKYKFSWAPVGVLKALRSPSRSLRDFKELKVDRPWNAITGYDAPLPQPESFEVYPNRDSYPFMEDYRFDKGWKVKDFVRGTIRLNGWAKAWDPVFKEIETLSGPDGRCAAGRDGGRVPEGERLCAGRARPRDPVRVAEGRARRQDRCSTRPGRWMPGATSAAPPWAGWSRCRCPSRWSRC